jgi:hypothetical protein
MPSEAPPARWHSLLVRLRLIAKPQMMRKVLLAAGVVGMVLVLLNQGDLIMTWFVTVMPTLLPASQDNTMQNEGR